MTDTDNDDDMIRKSAAAERVRLLKANVLHPETKHEAWRSAISLRSSGFIFANASSSTPLSRDVPAIAVRSSPSAAPRAAAISTERRLLPVALDVSDANADFSFASPSHLAFAPAVPAFVSGCSSSYIALRREMAERSSPSAAPLAAARWTARSLLPVAAAVEAEKRSAVWLSPTWRQAGNTSQAGLRRLQAAATPVVDKDTGEVIRDADPKAAGRVERLFASHADPLPEPVACSAQWARKFMAIAQNAVLANRKHTFVLPPAVETLSDLSKLPDEKLEIALSEGWVSPQTQRRDVKEIRERLAIEKPSAERKNDETPFGDGEDKFADKIEEMILKQAMKIIPFAFGENLVRVVDKDDAPWFVAKDACEALGLGNVSMAVDKLDADERMTISLTDSHSGQRGGAQSLLIVSESGLYALALRCRDAMTLGSTAHPLEIHERIVDGDAS